MLEQRKAWYISDIIKEICKQYEERDEKKIFADDGWCVYAKDSAIALDTICFIDGYPEINDNDEEI